MFRAVLAAERTRADGAGTSLCSLANNGRVPDPQALNHGPQALNPSR